MDRLTTYRQMVQRILLQFADQWDDSDTIKTELLFDPTHDNYMMLRFGWDGHKRVDSRPFFVRLRNGKIFIDDDWSEEGIANLLVEAGVSHDDIILAFNPPDLRELTAFAVA